MAVACLAASLGSVAANEREHKYNVGERVNLWVNRVGPYHNPQETYNYYKLPFCHPDLGLDAKKKSLTIGETLEGHDLTNSGYEIHFARAWRIRRAGASCGRRVARATRERRRREREQTRRGACRRGHTVLERDDAGAADAQSGRAEERARAFRARA